MSKIHEWSRLLWVGALLGVLLGAVPAARAMTLDEEYALLAEQVPGFGGLYLDETGTTYVYLVDLAYAREVEGLGEHVVAIQGDYDFRDLFAWKDELRALLPWDDVVALDIDERRNRLVVGAEEDQVAELQAALAGLLENSHVPPEAVIVEPDEAMIQTALLTDTIRPVPAGVQIGGALPASGQRTCTLGANGARFGVEGFVTASHCTTTQSLLEGSVFFQSSIGLFPPANVGVETVDPPYIVGGPCPVGRKCRYSDAAFIAYDSESLSEGGQIANPIVCGPAAGPKLIDSAQPRLPVTGYSYHTPAAGTVLTKVGRTTGCSIGSLKSTCVDLPVFVLVGSQIVKTNVIMLCQNRVGSAVGGGDSGAPVFRRDGHEATLFGILWSGNLNGTLYSFSPWFSVFQELTVFPSVQ